MLNIVNDARLILPLSQCGVPHTGNVRMMRCGVRTRKMCVCARPVKWFCEHELTRQMQMLSGLCREEKEIEIWKMCKLCLKGKIYMFIWNRKLNWLYKGNAQLKEDDLRLKQTWQ